MRFLTQFVLPFAIGFALMEVYKANFMDKPKEKAKVEKVTSD